MSAVVLIACPETDDLVPTGVQGDALADLPFVNHLDACTACGGAHEWTKAEAVITVTTG